MKHSWGLDSLLTLYKELQPALLALEAAEEMSFALATGAPRGVIAQLYIDNHPDLLCAEGVDGS